MESDKKIVRLIKRKRQSIGYSQSQVVTFMQLAGIDISVQIYKNIEVNRRRLTVVEFLFLINFLGIDINEFYTL